MILAPQLIAVDPRQLSAFGAAIVCILFLLQFAHRRKPFILIWAAAWTLFAPSMLLVDRAYPNVILGRAAIGLSQALVVCASALIFWSADVFRQTRYVHAVRWPIAAAVGAWLVVAPLFGTPRALVPGHIVNAVILGAAASMYAAVVIERRMIGAGLVAFVLLGIAVSSAASAVLLSRSASSTDAIIQLFVVNAVLSIFGALGVHLLVFEDMTYELRATNRRLEAAREELLQAAITDPLTGCHNRRFLDQVMDRELQRHARFNLPLSLLFVDIDRFKAINDSLGHEAGDRVLRHVARFLKQRIREADYVCRWGGDEFLVLITCNAAEARRKSAAIKAAFDWDTDVGVLPPGVGLSVGSIEVPPGTTDLRPLVNEADARMYRDKTKLKS